MLRLIVRMLKSGILEDGLTEQGTALFFRHCCRTFTYTTCWTCGSANVCAGNVKVKRTTFDDFLACFQYKGEAERFRFQLEDRLEEFGLKLAMEKTHCLEFGRYARENAYKRGEKPKEFTFLGFTHYCGKTREGYYKVKPAPAVRSWAKACAGSRTGPAKPGA